MEIKKSLYHELHPEGYVHPEPAPSIARLWLPELERIQAIEDPQKRFAEWIRVSRGIKLAPNWMALTLEQKAEYLDKVHPLSKVDKE